MYNRNENNCRFEDSFYLEVLKSYQHEQDFFFSEFSSSSWILSSMMSLFISLSFWSIFETKAFADSSMFTLSFAEV
jgi:hypothetical protein